jgi:hypothetical protein
MVVAALVPARIMWEAAPGKVGRVPVMPIGASYSTNAAEVIGRTLTNG